mmetsp:Transcript_9546/g.20136  ORF Transcript_9546/g.20136 Transcript_9546/m.20136 type:complete len:95 (+) Transcript_9546:43-327(+)
MEPLLPTPNSPTATPSETFANEKEWSQNEAPLEVAKYSVLLNMLGRVILASLSVVVTFVSLRLTTSPCGSIVMTKGLFGPMPLRRSEWWPIAYK